jgi:hypothetical protein
MAPLDPIDHFMETNRPPIGYRHGIARGYDQRGRRHPSGHPQWVRSRPLQPSEETLHTHLAFVAILAKNAIGPLVWRGE